MISIRIRSIERTRCANYECRDCGRGIGRGDGCVEISTYEPGRVWSEYTCCRAAHQLKRVRRWGRADERRGYGDVGIGTLAR